ncbi:MAG: phosphate acyltransferase PlsX [Gammaproteobacteria bacterium]
MRARGVGVSATIAIDAMGGDHGPSVTVPAALRALRAHPGLQLVLVGDRAVLGEELRRNRAESHAGLTVVHATQTVAMDERPSAALRGKKDSSMRVALNLVKEGGANACVSAGNTGALMATARFVLKTLPGIDRPALGAMMPGLRAPTYVLDLGANVDSSSEELFQFAVMGSVLVESVHNKSAPSVALLNVGEEEIKGNDRVKQTAALLAASRINYAGFAEGDDLYTGTYDVIVCDGFVGNIALKASEGVAKMIMQNAREEFERNLFTRLAALLSMPVLRALRRRADPRRYNGASLLGLRGTVVKSHGGADALSFARAIDEAVRELEKSVPDRISDRLESLLTTRQAV